MRRRLPFDGGVFVAQTIDDSGVSGSAGTIVQYALGAESQHSLGLYGALTTASNTAATNRITGNATAISAPQRAENTSDGDSWAEYGVNASLSLSQTLVLDLWLSRTAGVPAPG